MKLLCCCLLLLSTLTVAAAEQPIVRVEVTPREVDVGEATELRVTVLVPTWFIQPPEYPDFELPNAITRLPADSSFPLRERVGNESWSGIVRRYEIYPMVGATFRLGAETIELRYANPGADPIRADLPVPEITFRGVVPAGAETLDPYIAGSSLRLTLDVQGDVEALAVGDALVLRYTAELDGMSVMFLPPLAPMLELDGASVYADAPEVDDGEIARRSETLTLVFDGGGEFAVPETALSYWNTSSNSVETVTTPAMTFTVKGPLASTPETPVATPLVRWSRVAMIIASLALFAFVAVRLVRALTSRIRSAAEVRRASERYAFKVLEQALLARQPDAAYRSLLAWVERIGPHVTAVSLARSYGDEDLASRLDSLSEHLFGNQAKAVEFVQLATGLRAARKRWLASASSRRRQTLPALNP